MRTSALEVSGLGFGDVIVDRRQLTALVRDLSAGPLHKIG
jgi:hypothetical protein